MRCLKQCLAIVSLSGMSIVAAAVRWDRLLWTAHHSDDLPCTRIHCLETSEQNTDLEKGDSYDVGIWNLVEVNVGLICASAPALKPLIRKVTPGFLSSLSDRTFGSTRRTRSIGNSRVRGQVIRSSNTLELSSQPDFKFPQNEITRPKGTWVNGSTMRKTSSDSEAAVLGLESLNYR
jgi:hypothetical protein